MISRESYYAQAIVNSYNWKEISERGITDDAKEELIKKLQEFDIIELYKNIKKFRVQEKDILKYVLNIILRKSLLEEQDFTKMFQENEETLKQKISIEQLDRLLGYYDVDKADFHLKDFQQDAFDASKERFITRKFTTVVMPTGGGKSFVALAHILEPQNEKILYLAPDEEILEQIMDYIIEYVPGINKTSENKSKQEMIYEKLGVKFDTYPGLMAKAKKDPKVLEEQFDLIVLDELHRTGAENWGKYLDTLLENQKEETKVLGITATPIRDVDGKDMSAITAEKLGYTKEDIDAGKHIAYNLDLIEAIQDKTE